MRLLIGKKLYFCTLKIVFLEKQSWVAEIIMLHGLQIGTFYSYLALKCSIFSQREILQAMIAFSFPFVKHPGDSFT